MRAELHQAEFLLQAQRLDAGADRVALEFVGERVREQIFSPSFRPVKRSLAEFSLDEKVLDCHENVTGNKMNFHQMTKAVPMVGTRETPRGAMP